jgi:hypothetical protein
VIVPLMVLATNVTLKQDPRLFLADPKKKASPEEKVVNRVFILWLADHIQRGNSALSDHILLLGILTSYQYHYRTKQAGRRTGAEVVRVPAVSLSSARFGSPLRLPFISSPDPIRRRSHNR